MKHGDKPKGKTAQAASKASGKSSKAGGQKSGGAKAQGGKAGEGKSSKAGQASPKASAKTAVAKKTDTEAKGGNGKAAVHRSPDGGFTNPVVGNAFKRAVKKYPNAFRRLTD